MQRVSLWCLGLLTTSLVVYPLPLPDATRFELYDAIAVATLALGWFALLRQRPVHRAGWALVLLGFSAWVTGDLVWSIEEFVVERSTYPGYSDALYVAGYASLILGAQSLARRRGRRMVASILDATIPAVGCAVPARYGGEEFTVLMAQTGLAEAAALLERVRAATPRGETVPAGVAEWNPGTDPAAAVGNADAALYEAKRRGRNTTIRAAIDERDSGSDPLGSGGAMPVVPGPGHEPLGRDRPGVT